MTKVIVKLRSGLGFAVSPALIFLSVAAWCQAVPSAVPPAPSASGPAEALYLQLNSVGLDENRVFHIHDAPLNESAVHLNFDNGTIAFTRDVAGRVTGAFFEGEGELLLAPPNQLERASMVRFTGAAILEERFNTAYFRFNDDTFEQLQPFMKPADGAKEFATEWNETSRNLASADALRLLLSFTSSSFAAAKDEPQPEDYDDRFFHARVEGRRLGPFDVLYDSMAGEQIWAGQAKTVEGGVYYDLWTSFTPVVNSRTMTVEIEAPSRQDAISVVSYKVRTEIRLPKAIRAEADLQVEVHQGGQRTLMFELSRFLQVKAVTADGHPVEFVHNPAVEGTQLSRRGNDLVAVVFPQPLKEGQHTELHFVYEGDVLSDAGSGLLYVGARGTWFPNRRFSMSNFDLEFHYPAGWTLLATGKRVEDTGGNNPGTAAANSGEQVSRWISQRPIPVAGFNLGKYHHATAHAGKVNIETYASGGVEESFPKPPAEIISQVQPIDPRHKPESFIVSSPPPPSPAQNAQKVADASAQAVDFFSRLYGPYPYSSLALTQNPGVISQGWPGLVFLSSYSFLTDSERLELHMSPLERTLSGLVPAHETAHQWWGDLVGWDSYHDQWVVEALANYSSLLLLESNSPRDFQEVLDGYRDALLQKDRDGTPTLEAGPVTLGARLSNSHSPGGYEAISYGRGTWLLHMMRCMMRDAALKAAKGPIRPPATADEPFFRALRNLRDQSEGKEITTRDLLSAFESELPRPLWHEGQKSLEWFYEGWIKGTAVPHYELRDVKFSGAGPGSQVTGTLLQADAPDNLITPVPIYASAGNAMTFLGSVFADGPETQFKLSVPRGMRKLVLDPNQTILSRK